MADFNRKNLRIPPQSIEAEAALLGSVMLRPEVLHDIFDTISSASFYSEKHRIIFEAMLDLFRSNSPIDLLSLGTRLKEKNQLDAIGGNTYLAEIVNLVPSSANIKHYADIVNKKFMMRNLIQAAESVVELGFDEAENLEIILDKADKHMLEVTNYSGAHKFIALKDTLAEAWERFDRLHNAKGELRGVPTGFPELDSILSGFQNSDLIILAARPSVGKTSLALDIARMAAVNHNIPIGIFSLEMSSQQLVDRMLAAQAQVDAWKLRTGKLTNEEDFGLIRQSLDRLATAPIFIDDQPGNNILKMRSVARRLKREKGLGMIVVDYLQLMTPTYTKAGDSMVQQVTEISRSLKNLARELNVPVLALSQLSRAIEQRGGKPRLSDLRDSGSIEQDADVVMFIHREDKYKEESERNNMAEILIEKHRNGPTGRIELFFNDKKTSFQSVAKTGMGKDDFGQF
jgi:replicative DNA helicase